MRDRTRSIVSVVLAATSLAVCGVAAVPLARAQGAKPAGSSSARPAGAASAAPLPAGHPPVDEEPAMPPGHPPTGAGGPHGANPHGAGGPRDPREAPQNGSREDPTLPRGTIVIEVRTPDEKPVAGQEVTLGIVENSVARGESRKRLAQRTDDQGTTTFSALDGGTENAYRVSIQRDGASSAASPFQLPNVGGVRVVVYAYPVVRNVREASVAVQGIVYVELRDEVIQIEQAYRIYNLGQTAWVPSDVTVALPAGFKAFNAQKMMSDLAWDGTSSGASLRGTIPPGLHETVFRYQLPNDGKEELALDFGLLPNVQSFRVIVEAPRGMTLDVDGFPPAIPTQNGQGQRILFTEKTTDRIEPNFRSTRVRLGNLPARSKGHLWALGLAIGALAAGLYATTSLGRQKDSAAPEEIAQAKERLLDALVALEKDHAAGEVGPRTYESTKTQLLDALARLLARENSAAGGDVDKPGTAGGPTSLQAPGS